MGKLVSNSGVTFIEKIYSGVNYIGKGGKGKCYFDQIV